MRQELKKSFIFVVACFCLLPVRVLAQENTWYEETARTVPSKSLNSGQYDWTQFVEDYLQYVAEMSEESDNEVERYDWLEELEEIHRSPIDVNTASRDDLCALHFLNDAQVDSILSRRDRYAGGFRSVGELLTVPQLSYRERAWLSVLLRFDKITYSTNNEKNSNLQPTQKSNPAPLTQNRWYGGTHDLLGTMDVPLYRRAGFYDYDADNYLTKMFTGQRVGHTLRYRYNWHQRVKYGATVQQDVGERFGAYGARPWDFGALYFFFKSDAERRGRYTFNRYTVSVGDYRMSLGQGLLMGMNSWQQPMQLLSGLRMETTVMRPHTGTDESRFLRGAAGTVRLGRQGNWSVSAFASWRRLDGSVQGADKTNDYDPHASDVITAWKTDGLHRTLQEINKRNVATQLLGGGRVGWQNERANIGINAVGLHYDKDYQPALRQYNKYYMRGHDAAAFSTDYALRVRQWSLQGELAIDRNGGYASTAALRWIPQRSLSLVLQERSFGRGFVSPYGQTLQAGSQLQNEHGVMAGVRFRPGRRIELTAYGDYAYHPHAVYLADTTSHRFEASAVIDYHSGHRWTHSLRYKIKGREQNVSGYKDVMPEGEVLLAWRTTQHLRWQSSWSGRSCNVTLGADGCYYYSQGTSIDKHSDVASGASLGGLLFARATYKMQHRLTASVLLAGFFTDDYASRCYAYLPQLKGGVSVPNFYGRGLAGVVQAECRVWRELYVALRVQTAKYFDRDAISSGINRIESPMKKDLSVQVRYRF